MVGGTWARWRGRKWPVDLLFMLPLLALTVLAAPSYTTHMHRQDPISEPVYGTFLVLLLAPLVWRRRHPRAVFAFVAAAAFAQWCLNVDLMIMDLGVLVAMYTVAADCAFRWGLAAGLVTEAGALLAVVRYFDGWSARQDQLITFSAVVGGVWLLGIYLSTRRKYLRSLEERAARLERERDTQVQIAMAAERARIARELHDVVAHNVSVIVVQADGASYAIKTDVARAARALETISATGRVALAEMRRLLGVLREDDDAGSYAPQPGVDQLTDLVSQLRDAGLPLEFHVGGVPQELSPGLALTVYRIVQESLTNTLKHAGPRVSAYVEINYGDSVIEIRVTDNGRGAAAGIDGRRAQPGTARLGAEARGPGGIHARGPRVGAEARGPGGVQAGGARVGAEARGLGGSQAGGAGWGGEAGGAGGAAGGAGRDGAGRDGQAGGAGRDGVGRDGEAWGAGRDGVARADGWGMQAHVGVGGGAVGGGGRGHGLVGMRERVALYGGTVRAGPMTGGGFEVVARLPLREEARAR